MLKVIPYFKWLKCYENLLPKSNPAKENQA